MQAQQALNVDDMIPNSPILKKPTNKLIGKVSGNRGKARTIITKLTECFETPSHRTASTMADKFTPLETITFPAGTGVTAVSTGDGLIPRQPEETFEQWLKKNVREYPLTLELPDGFLASIARIVTYWATAEWIQQGTLSRLLKMDKKELRVILGAPRVSGSASKITELVKSMDIAVTVNMLELTTKLRECESARNLLGHGVWLI
jgi:hypothetical protein